MGIILDTSALIEAEKGRLNVEDLVDRRENEHFGMSGITVSEVLHGVHRADSRKRRLKRSATALSLGFSVVTFNKRHFDRIEGLDVEILLPAPE